MEIGLTTLLIASVTIVICLILVWHYHLWNFNVARIL